MAESNAIKKHLWSAVATVVAALLVQSFAACYWAGSIAARVRHCEQTLQGVCQRVHDLELNRLVP